MTVTERGALLIDGRTCNCVHVHTPTSTHPLPHTHTLDPRAHRYVSNSNCVFPVPSQAVTGPLQ